MHELKYIQHKLQTWKLKICLIYFLLHAPLHWCLHRGKNVFISLLFNLSSHVIRNPNITRPYHISQNRIQSSTFLYPSLWLLVLLKRVNSCSFGLEWYCRLQSGKAERSAAAPRWLLTSFALCGGLFPALTGSAHIGNRFSLTVDLSQSLTESTLSCSVLHAEKEEGIEGGGSFETHLPHLAGCGVFPSLFILSLFFFTTAYFLSFYFFHSLHQTAALSSSCRAYVSLLSAICFFKCQHTAARLGGGVTPARAGRRGSTQSPGSMEQPGPKHKYSTRHTITARF